MTEERVEQVLDIKIRVRTNRDEEKIICLTDFCEPQSVELNYDNKEVILCIKKNKYN